MIGKLNRVVTFEVWENSQDTQGSAIQTVSETFTQRASVKDRSGGQLTNEGQQQWDYNTEITVRFARELKSNMTLIYENFRYTINSISTNSEGHKRWNIIRCSKTQTWLESGS